LKSLPEANDDLSIDSSQTSGTRFDTRAGVIVGAHGVQGTVKVKPVTGTSYKLLTPNDGVKGLDVFLGSDPDNGAVVHVLSSKRLEPKEIYLVRLRDIDDRTSAEALVGKSIFGKSVDREALADDEFFVEDLIGLKVVDRSSVDLGTLTVVHAGVANDVYETDRGLLIPAVKAFIDRVDLSNRTITVADAAALVMD
jgi:16S rRNA processing protein RimM